MVQQELISACEQKVHTMNVEAAINLCENIQFDCLRGEFSDSAAKTAMNEEIERRINARRLVSITCPKKRTLNSLLGELIDLIFCYAMLPSIRHDVDAIWWPYCEQRFYGQYFSVAHTSPDRDLLMTSMGDPWSIRTYQACVQTWWGSMDGNVVAVH